LEWAKPGFEQPVDAAIYKSTISFFEELMQMLHPFMPFVSEEIYHQLKDQNDDLCVKQFQFKNNVDATILQQGELLKQSISALRDVRVKNNIKPKETIRLHIQAAEEKSYLEIESILAKQVNTASIVYVPEAVPNTIALLIGKDKFFIEAEQTMDVAAQKVQLQKELDYLQGFLISVEKKLNNERFVQNAKPEVVEIERRKQADAREKIIAIEDNLKSLN
jgi:valyl-tRNA synthetase